MQSTHSLVTGKVHSVGASNTLDIGGASKSSKSDCCDGELEDHCCRSRREDSVSEENMLSFCLLLYVEVLYTILLVEMHRYFGYHMLLQRVQLHQPDISFLPTMGLSSVYPLASQIYASK